MCPGQRALRWSAAPAVNRCLSRMRGFPSRLLPRLLPPRRRSAEAAGSNPRTAVLTGSGWCEPVLFSVSLFIECPAYRSLFCPDGWTLTAGRTEALAWQNAIRSWFPRYVSCRRRSPRRRVRLFVIACVQRAGHEAKVRCVCALLRILRTPKHSLADCRGVGGAGSSATHRRSALASGS